VGRKVYVRLLLLDLPNVDVLVRFRPARKRVLGLKTLVAAEVAGGAGECAESALELILAPRLWRVTRANASGEVLDLFDLVLVGRIGLAKSLEVKPSPAVFAAALEHPSESVVEVVPVHVNDSSHGRGQA
jgi:hypothetical protein